MQQTKRIRTFLMLVLSMLFVCSTALAVAFAYPGRASADENGDPSNLIDEIKTVPYEPETKPVATYYLGRGGIHSTATFYYAQHSTGWAEAVNAAKAAYQDNPNAYVKVILSGDWTASTSATNNTSFGTTPAGYTPCFDVGRIYVPAGVNIVLDLNGRKIDRGLYSVVENGEDDPIVESTPTASGNVMFVYGNLTIIDNSTDQTGLITGGNNSTGTGGGIYAVGGDATLNLYGGTIEGNTGLAANIYGLGVCLNGNATAGAPTFNMYGGRIANNSATITTVSTNTASTVWGGGVAVLTNSYFNMFGGVIENNTATVGGGIVGHNLSLSSEENPAIVIDGGVIRNNTTEKGTCNHSNLVRGTINAWGGGGIAIYQYGHVNFKSGAISGNRSDYYGGAILTILSAAEHNVTVSISGSASIHHNIVASLERNVYGAGIAQRKLNSDASGTITMNGGNIYDNIAIGNSVTKYKVNDEGKYVDSTGAVTTNSNNYVDTTGANGGGVYFYGGIFTMRNGKIYNNRACSVNYVSQTDNHIEFIDEAGFEAIVAKHLAGEDVSDYVVDGVRSYGGAVSVYNSRMTGANGTPAVALFVMTDGELYGNRATSGGAVADQGDFEMNNGSIHDNYGESGAIYVMAQSTITLSGNAKIDGNYSIYKYDSDGDGVGDQLVAANLNIAAADERRIQFTGDGFEEGASIHVYVTENLIENGQAFTQNYGEYNRKFIPFNGIDEEAELVDSGKKDENDNPIFVPGNGVYVYENPYRYLSSDTVFSVEGTTVKLDKTVPQNFMVLSGTYTASKKLYNSVTNKWDIDHEYDVNVEGEIGVARDSITFRVYFSDEPGDYKDYSYGNVALTEDNAWNYASFTYGDERFPTRVEALVSGKVVETQVGKWVNGNVVNKSDTVGKDVGVYTMMAVPKSPDNTTDTIKTTASFHIVVLPKEMETGMDNLVIDISGHEEYHYDGQNKEPAVNSVTYKFTADGEVVTLAKADNANAAGDYWVSYDKNRNAGDNTAEVIIHFMGNYVGTAIENFTIYSSENTDITTDVSWEVYDGSDWVAYEGDDIFVFNGSSQAKYVRARLTASGAEDQTVYVEGYRATDDDYQNTSMSIVFSQGTSEVDFINAGTYSVYVSGTSYTNYPIDEDGRTLTGLVISPMTISASEADFKDTDNSERYEDESGTRLWTLLIKSGDTVTRSLLRDNSTYIDNVLGKDNGHGVKITNGDKYDYYARYRSAELSLELNEDYVLVNGMTLAQLIAYDADVSVAAWYTGELNAVTQLTTTITITFNGNYVVGSTNKIELTKNWAIVTMTNDLLNADTLKAVTSEDTSLHGWTYYDIDDIQPEVFRPEHGDTVIYTYYKLNGDGTVEKTVGRFAIVYSDDTNSAIRRVYEVKEENGTLSADTEKLLGDASYLYTFSYDLVAGEYTVTVTVPEPVVGEGHRHWYDGDSVGDDNGVVYYEFEYEFSLTVAVYELDFSSFEEDENLEITFPDEIDNFVYYTGDADNIVPDIHIYLFGRELEEGVDYVLTSVNYEAGAASLTITGLNNLFGTYTIENAFVIRQAINGWYDLPSIANWTYNAFDREINLINGEHHFGKSDITFMIAKNSDGTGVLLDNIILDSDGCVPAAMVNTLRSLDVGNYYLFAYVEATNNYSGLENSVQFRVFRATNTWVITPAVNAWTEGQFAGFDEHFAIAPEFGTALIKIVGDDGVVYYDSAAGINILETAKNGHYTLTASVVGTDNYSDLADYTIRFEIFKKPGLPWWAALSITLGALLLAALIIFILWKNGVFRIITDKILVSIRTRVSVEATIASVRAAKMMEEGKKSVEEAKRKERLEQMRQKAKEFRELPPEEIAAKLEERARLTAERAAKMMARSEAAQARAAKVREQATADDEAPADTAPETEVPNGETPDTTPKE